MVDIRIEVDVNGDVTRVTTMGQADPNRIIAVFSAPEYGRTSRIVWDYRAASLSDLGQDKLTEIARAVNEIDRPLNTRGLVFVVRTEDARLLMKLYTEISQHQFGRDIQYHITTDIDDARRWLDEHAPAIGSAKQTGRRTG